MRYCVYKITNIINNKVYIGMTKHSAEERFRIHLKNSRSKGQIFLRALEKYGEENFKVEEIDYADSIEDAWEKEKYWIGEYKSNHSRYPNNGYNMTDGGEGITGYIATEEHRKNLSKANTGKVMPDWVKDKISKAHKSRDGLSDKQIERLNNLHEKRKREGSYRPELMNTPEAMYKKRKTLMIKQINRLLDDDLVGFLFTKEFLNYLKNRVEDELIIKDDYCFVEVFYNRSINEIIDKREELKNHFNTNIVNRKIATFRRGMKIILELKELHKEVYKEVS